MLGHKKTLCRFNGLCFRCKSPDHAVPICRFVSQPLRQSYSQQPKVMAGLSPHCPIMIPPSKESCEQLYFFSSCAIITPHAPRLSKDELEVHLLRHWPSSLGWEVFEFVNGKFLIKFSSQTARDEVLKTSGASLVSLPASFAPWFVHSSSVFTLRDKRMWIRLEGIPHHL